MERQLVELGRPFPAALFISSSLISHCGACKQGLPGVSTPHNAKDSSLLSMGAPELTCHPPSDLSVVFQEQALSFGSESVDVTARVLEKQGENRS